MSFWETQGKNMKTVTRSRRWIAWTLAAGSMLLSFGCRSATPAKIEVHIGENAIVGPLTYNVVEAQWRSQLEASPTPRIPERNFLMLRVLVTNGGGSETAIPFLKVENSSGDSFTESENGAGVDKWLGMLRRISPAQTEDGWLLFDVPTNSYKLRVSDGAVENEHVAYISVPLSMQTDVPKPRVP